MEPIIKDSGDRTEFSTGAVRDMSEDKGRFDLMPLALVAALADLPEIDCIRFFQKTGDTSYLADAIHNSCDGTVFSSHYDMLLEVAKHFEQGAKKYGENNWQKGIPIHSYVDSAIRHLIKYKAGWTDEPHDRAYIWNLMCCIWTMENKPEMDDFTEVIKRDQN